MSSPHAPRRDRTMVHLPRKVRAGATRSSGAALGLALRAALALACVAAHAQSADPPAVAASEPGPGIASQARTAVRSLSSFLSGLTAPASPQPASEAAPDKADQPPASPGEDSKAAAAFNPIDIDKWSKTASVVLDPECNTPVQPFSIADNGASLAMLAAKLKVQEMVGKWLKSGPQQARTSEIVKLAARNLNWLPMDIEVRLGEAMRAQADLVDEEKNQDTRRAYAQARATLADIVKGLPPSVPYQFSVVVATSSAGSAQALPGGILVVDRDLFRKGADLDYTHFVMAHEVAHVLQRHQTRAYQGALVDGIDSLGQFSRLLEKASRPDPADLLGYAGALKKLVLDFSEEQELQADSCAVRIMARQFSDERVMEAKLKAIEQRWGTAGPALAAAPIGRGVGAQLEFLAQGSGERHPHPAKRRANLYVAFRAARQAK